MSAARGNSSFHVGDQVKIDFGRRKLTGVVVEDRGAIGAGGRHLFRVHVPMDPFEPMMVELPGDEMEAVAAGGVTARPIDKERVIEYLVNGGLISILRSNLSGGRNQPRVWLCLDNLGNVTHTFLPERGVVGGQPVPAGAVQDDRVLSATREAVVSFLQTFGLSRHEAERVVSEVGTTP